MANPLGNLLQLLGLGGDEDYDDDYYEDDFEDDIDEAGMPESRQRFVGGDIDQCQQNKAGGDDRRGV